MNITMNGVEYNDGPQTSLCAREKAVRDFNGTVLITDSGRIISSGSCSQCGRYMELALYTP